MRKLFNKFALNMVTVIYTTGLAALILAVTAMGVKNFQDTASENVINDYTNQVLDEYAIDSSMVELNIADSNK